MGLRTHDLRVDVAFRRTWSADHIRIRQPPRRGRVRTSDGPRERLTPLTRRVTPRSTVQPDRGSRRRRDRQELAGYQRGGSKAMRPIHYFLVSLLALALIGIPASRFV